MPGSTSITDLVQQLTSANAAAAAAAAGCLARLASSTDANRDANRRAIVAAGGIRSLVELARTGDMQAKVHAAAALRNLTMNAENDLVIAREGGISVLLELARTGSAEVKARAARLRWWVSMLVSANLHAR